MSTRRAFSVAIFARRDGRILLIEHRRLNCWLPVGGEIEAGETPLEAAARELREETGLEGKFTIIRGVDGTPPGFIGYEEHQAGSKGLHMNFAFAADVNNDDVRSNGEFTNYRWLDSTEGIDCPANVTQLFERAKYVDNDPAGVARRWILYFNNRDLDALLNLYSDDAAHHSPKLKARRPETGGVVRGKAALRDWYQDAFSRLPDLRYIEKHVTAGPGRVLLEYERVNPGEASYTVAEVYQVVNNKIKESFVYHG